jgi:hypothetical protein
METIKKTRGAPRKSAEEKKTYVGIRLTPAHKQLFRTLGGGKWLETVLGKAEWLKTLE